MSENKFETLSAFLDQQNVDSSVLDDVKHDDKLSSAWGRYHLIGDVMRGETADFVDLDLSDDIAVAIAAEPTLLAPQTKLTVQQRIKAKVVDFVKPAGQFAIAASAAGLMVLGVQQANIQDESAIVPTQVFQPSPLGVADPVSYNFETQSVSNQRRAAYERQQRLQAILSDHQMQIKLNSEDETVSLEAQNQKLGETN